MGSRKASPPTAAGLDNLSNTTLRQHRAFSALGGGAESVIYDATGHIVLLLAPWHDPIPVTRAWCLWEIYSTLVAGSMFEIGIAKAEIDGLRAAVLVKGPDALTDAMVEVDAKNAECFMPADRDRIFAALDAMEGGFHRLNAEVKAMMRRWVLGRRRAAAQTLEPTGRRPADPLSSRRRCTERLRPLAPRGPAPVLAAAAAPPPGFRHTERGGVSPSVVLLEC